MINYLSYGQPALTGRPAGMHVLDLLILKDL